jgi:peptide/nickel transport system permease protein
MFANAVPVSLALELPGFILGNLLAIALALWAAYNRGKRLDRFLMVFSVVGMSISLLIVCIGFQILLCSSDFLDLFPVQGWDVNSLKDYFMYVATPTLATGFVALGYNTRFYRAVFVDEMGRDHVRTARAFGCPPGRLLFRNILKNSLIPIITRIVFSLPYLLIAGSLVIETYFSVPGVGLVTYNAITSGDQPVLKAAVAVTAVFYIFALTLNDILYKLVDPRIK